MTSGERRESTVCECKNGSCQSDRRRARSKNFSDRASNSASGAGNDANLHPKRQRRCLDVSQLGSGEADCSGYPHCDAARSRGCNLANNSSRFAPWATVRKVAPVRLPPAGSSSPRDRLYRIDGQREYDWDGAVVSHFAASVATVDAVTAMITTRVQPVRSHVSGSRSWLFSEPAILDRDVLPFDMAGLA